MFCLPMSVEEFDLVAVFFYGSSLPEIFLKDTDFRNEYILGYIYVRFMSLHNFPLELSARMSITRD